MMTSSCAMDMCSGVRSDASIAVLPMKIAMSPYEMMTMLLMMMMIMIMMMMMNWHGGGELEIRIIHTSYFTLERSGPLRVLLSKYLKYLKYFTSSRLSKVALP